MLFVGLWLEEQPARAEKPAASSPARQGDSTIVFGVHQLHPTERFDREETGHSEVH